MSVWWGRELREPLPLVESQGASAPTVVRDDRKSLGDAVRARVPSFAPRWLGAGSDDDAGEALVRVFGDLATSVARRLNRLPEKASIELLRRAGVTPLLGSPGATLVQFEVSPAAPKPVFIGKGFRLGAKPATGDLDLVELETTEPLFASPGKLARALVQEGAFFQQVTIDDAASAKGFLPFGAGTGKDCALWLGIASAVHPGRQLKLAFGAVPPTGPILKSAGGRVARRAAPIFGWDALNGDRVTVISDTTSSFTASGLVELRTPAEWRPGRPDDSGDPLYWLRLRLLSGDRPRNAALHYVLLNATPAAATVTVRDRVLEPVDGPDGARWRLPLTPVLKDTLEIVVDDATAALNGDSPVTEWKEVADLAEARNDQRVYTLDHQDGIVTFGDGIHGAKLPVGYRHVHARTYRMAFGAESAIEAGSLTVLLSNAPLLIGATNPLPATGGRAAESPVATVERGPRELRARGRAVAVADYGLIATQSDGAIITRAYGVAGHHPEMPGVALPGVVGVLVVGQPRAGGPPVPSEQELEAVAGHVQHRAPAGVEIVVSPPRFHIISAEVSLGVREGADSTETVLHVINALDQYFDPLVGSDDGKGWPLGAPIRYAALLRHLLKVDGVASVPTLTLTLDGRRGASCEDVRISATGLLWPGPHDVVPARPRGGT